MSGYVPDAGVPADDINQPSEFLHTHQARHHGDPGPLPALTLPEIHHYLYAQAHVSGPNPADVYSSNGPYSPGYVYPYNSPASASDSSRSWNNRSSVATSIGSTEASGYSAAQGALAGPPEPQELFPIRATVESRIRGRPYDDPLLSGIQLVGQNLPSTLRSILNTPPPTARSPRLPLSIFQDAQPLSTFCRGATGVGGSLASGNGAVTPAQDHRQCESVQSCPAVLDLPNGIDLPKERRVVSPPPNQDDDDVSARSRTGAQSPIEDESRDQPVKQEAAGQEASAKENGNAKGKGGKAEFKSSFHFVVNKSGEDARKMVRKHVMKEYRRKERWQHGFDPDDQTSKIPNSLRSPGTPKKGKRPRTTSKTGPPQPTVANQSSDEASISPKTVIPGLPENSMQVAASGKRRRLMSPDLDDVSIQYLNFLGPKYDEAFEELEERRDLPYQADPYASVAASDVDPFSRLNLDLGPASKSLLHHFAWVMPSLMDEIVTGTVFNRIGWLYSAVAIHDPTPAHVILGFTLGHIAGLRGQEQPAAAIEHKNKALRLIQARMENIDEALSDETIGAVVNIAGYELVACDPKAFSFHMAGLKRMVSGRGGIANFRTRPQLETVLIRLDAIRAYISISTPRYPLYACVRPLEPLAIEIPRCSQSRENSQYFEYVFCEDMLHLIHSIEDLLLLLHSISKQLTGPIRQQTKDLVALSIQQLLSTDDLPYTLWSTHISRKCARLAALAFIDIAIQEFFDGDPPGTHTRRLKKRFLGLSAGVDKTAMAAWGRSLEMTIAVLLTADRLSLERPWRGWYFADALTLIMKLSAYSWDAVERELQAYLTETGSEQAAVFNSGARSASLWNLGGALDAFRKEWSQYELGGNVRVAEAS